MAPVKKLKQSHTADATSPKSKAKAGFKKTPQGKPAFKKGPQGKPGFKKGSPQKPRYIQKKNGKASFKKKIEDLSESDFDSDDDFGMNGPEYGPLSDTSSSDMDEDVQMEIGNDQENEGEKKESDSEENDDEEEENGKEDDDEDSGEESDSSSVELPEPEGSVEGDTSEEDTPKTNKPKHDVQTEARTIFIGNLPHNVKKKKLAKWFSKFGEVECVRLRCPPVANPEVPKKVSVMQKDFHADRTNINAFIRFVDLESVDKALEANNTKWDETHHIRVDRAISGKDHNDKKAVFVGNLPFDAEEDQIRDIFIDCGDIASIRIIRDRKTNVGKGFAYVNFLDRHSVALALVKNGETVGKRAIRVMRYNYDVSGKPAPEKKEQPKIQQKGEQRPKKLKNKKQKNEGKTESFQGELAKKREKRKKRKQGKMAQKKTKFIEVLNSKTKKHKTSVE